MNAKLLPSGIDLIQFINFGLHTSDKAFLIIAKISQSGLHQLQKELLIRKRKKKQTTIILGVDMISPSSPEAIQHLFQLHDGKYFNLLCYSGSEFFHPKFYAFQCGREWNFFIGSSNLTEEGLAKNIEFNISLSGAANKDKFVVSFQKNYSRILSECNEFSLKQIQLLFSRIPEINKNVRNLEKSFTNISDSIKHRQIIEISKLDKLIREIVSFKGSHSYNERYESISSAIRACRKTIGNPKNPSVNAERWNKKEVGYFSNLSNLSYYKTKVTSKRKLSRLNNILKFLLDENISIEKRLHETLLIDGSYHVDGMGISHISDILIKYWPEKYILLNAPIIEALKFYGMRYIPTDPVERYMIILDIFEKLRKESKYPRREGYLLLDQFMWKKGHKLLYGWS